MTIESNTTEVCREYKNGHVVYVENEDGGFIKWVKDEQGRVLRSEDSDGYCEEFKYDTDGNVIEEWNSINGTVFEKS